MALDKKKRKRDATRDGDDDRGPNLNGVTGKKQRLYTQEDAVFAKIYQDLAHEVGDVRLDAAKTLLDKLSSESAPDAEVFAKVLKRLIRGLCSSRKAARSGFFVALTEYFRLKNLQLPGESSTNKVEYIIQQYVDEGTTVEGGASSQEKRDHAIGRMLAYQAMIESRFVFEAQDSERLWKVTLQRIFSQAKNTRWLREEYCSVINNCIPELAREGRIADFINDILAAMMEQHMEHTPEGIALWLTAQNSGSNLSYPEGVWRKRDPLNKHERANVIRIMKSGAGNELKVEEGTPKSHSKGNQTRLGFAWNVLIGTVLSRTDQGMGQAGSKPEKNFKALWKELIDDFLFAENASAERKSLGLQLLSSTITTCPAWAISSILSRNIMRCIVNHRSDSQRLLHAAAKTPLDKIKNRVLSQPETSGPLLNALFFSTQTVNLDGLTKTKTIGDVLQEVDAQFLPEILDHIENLVVEHSGRHQELSDPDTNRRGFADMLLALVRGRSINLDEEWPRHLYEMLLKLSYFDQVTSPRVPISKTVRDIFRSRLLSCINHMVSSGAMASRICFDVISCLKQTRDNEDYTALLQADASIELSLNRAIETVDTMNQQVSSNEAASSQSPILNAFACLYTMTILRVYNEEPDAVSMLEEIDTAYRAVGESKGSVDEAFDLLVEVLLGMVSKQSALSRKLAEQAFAVIAPQLTHSALESMFDILAQKENVAGQNALFDADDGGHDAVDGLSGSDVEEVNEEQLIDDNGESESEDEDSSEEENMASDVSGENDEEEMQRLDASLGEILKTGRSGADEEEEATDDESMDDEQMMALEPYLTKIFQERKKASSKKKDNKDAKDMMINFKNRILDLLTIYAKQQYSRPLTLELILPLLRLISSSLSKQLSDKAGNLLGQYFELCGKKKEGYPKVEEPEDVWAQLETVLGEVSRNNSKAYQNMCSRSSLFLVKVLVYTGDDDPKGQKAQQTLVRGQDMFSGLQKQWMLNPKLEIHINLFQNWIGWCNDMRKAR
ncbi:MAG: DNA-directed DNA polymerase [Bathelium mastoideum]|nr:MAG: DNA-directed DNA polymerase [Bathelium mastoideum]